MTRRWRILLGNLRISAIAYDAETQSPRRTGIEVEPTMEELLRTIVKGSYTPYTARMLYHISPAAQNIVGTMMKDDTGIVYPLVQYIPETAGAAAALSEGRIHSVNQESGVDMVDKGEIPFSGGHLYTGDVLYDYEVESPAGVTAADTTTTGVNWGALGAGEMFLGYVFNPHLPAVSGTSPTLDGNIIHSANSDLSASSVASAITQLDDTDPETADRWEKITIDGDSTPLAGPYWGVDWTSVGGTSSPTFYPVVVGTIYTKTTHLQSTT